AAMFAYVQALPQEAKAGIYARIYALALVIPLVSVAGVLLQSFLQRRERRRFAALGMSDAAIDAAVAGRGEPTRPNWWILGGSLAFVVFSLGVGLSDSGHAPEIVFFGSMAIVLFLIVRITRVLDPDARRTLVGTA